MPVVEALPRKSRPRSCCAPETVTFVDLAIEPPGPAHVSVNVDDADSGPVVAEPDVGRLPDHAPLAVHELALADDHVRFEAAPLGTVVGVALSVSVGEGEPLAIVTVADLDTVPPLPVHARVYVRDELRAPVEYVPLVGLVPDQPPEAVQFDALVLLHASVELVPLGPDVGLALSDNVGAWPAPPPPSPADMSA